MNARATFDDLLLEMFPGNIGEESASVEGRTFVKSMKHRISINVRDVQQDPLLEPGFFRTKRDAEAIGCMLNPLVGVLSFRYLLNNSYYFGNRFFSA